MPLHLDFFPVEGENPFRAHVRQIIAQGDLVFALVHYPFPDENDPQLERGNIAVDIFRVDEEGKLIEHWDMIQSISVSQLHANGIF